MKSKNVVLASAMLISVVSFAQKDQIKAAEKSFKKGNIAEANSYLNEAEPLLTNATETDKAKFYYLRQSFYMDSVDKGLEIDKNLDLAAKATQEVINIEQKSGKIEYTPEMQKSIIKIKNKLINGAIADSKVNKYKEGSAKLYSAYLLDKKDTLNLYYASTFDLNGKDYDEALNKLQVLRNLKFTGSGKLFYATSVINDKEEGFSSIAERNKMVKLKTHIKPRVEILPSKQPEIYKNIALILVQQNNNEEAKKVIAEAKALNPKDTSLAITEANLYLESKDYATYKKLISEILQTNPNDADMLFNLGVISGKANNIEEAEMYYKRAIEVNPKYMNAYINLVATKLQAETPIITEMNKLGTSDKDNKRYAVLKAEKKKIYLGVIPYLEKALEIEPKNADIGTTLMSVYGALDMNAEKKALKEKMK